MSNAVINEYQNLRRKVFSEAQELDLGLTESAQKYPNHAYLTNPASQNIYLYLTKFVARLAEFHFNRKLAELNILDWGCGTGQISYFLSQLGAVTTGCDLDQSLTKPNLTSEPAIIQEFGLKVIPLNHEYLLPLADESFDVVLSFGVLEHVPRERDSLLEIHRILKPSGLFLCFFLPGSYAWTQRLAHLRGNYYHDRLYTKRKVANLMSDRGFEIIDFWYRQLFPKISVNYRNHHIFEQVDLFLTEHTPLKMLATNIEFVACKA